MRHILIALVLFSLFGCASQQSAPTNTIAKLPVVRVGEQPPNNTEYVTYFPAGYAFPVKLKTSGSLFVSEKQTESRVQLAKDLYLYKYWASHDGKSWENSHELIDVAFGGGFDVNGLQSNVKLNAK